MSTIEPPPWHAYEWHDTPIIFHNGHIVLHVNVAGCTLFRLGPCNEIDGTPINFLINPEARNISSVRMRVLKEMPVGAELPRIEYSFFRCGGSRFWAYVDTRWIAPGVAMSVLSRIQEDFDP